MNAKYYAVADMGGPISVRINAETASEAREWFLAQDENFGDEAYTDAEDDFGVCGDGMSHSEWSAVMESKGFKIVDGNLCGNHNWVLWERK